jgi:hypothetical protein
VLQFLVTAYVVPVLLILSTQMIEVIRFSETLVIAIATRHIPEDGILQENAAFRKLICFHSQEKGGVLTNLSHWTNYSHISTRDTTLSN